MNIAPSLFISHGAPIFALQPGTLGGRLSAVGANLVGVKAIAVISPHWQTANVRVMSGAAPATLHDFAGFPAPLYQLQYPAPGHPEFAREAAQMLGNAGLSVTLDETRGFDHGAWVPLMHMIPAADLPVFQISMPRWLNATEALAFGRCLMPLRAKGVMLVGSGSLTHNLTDLQPADSDAADYTLAFSAWIGEALTANDTEGLLKYRELAPKAERAHPSEEHFLPLLFAYGARLEGEVTHMINGGTTFGVLSMDSYGWGLPAARSLRRPR